MPPTGALQILKEGSPLAGAPHHWVKSGIPEHHPSLPPVQAWSLWFRGPWRAVGAPLEEVLCLPFQLGSQNVKVVSQAQVKDQTEG